MKKVLLAIVAILSVFMVTSCDDDNESKNPRKDIVLTRSGEDVVNNSNGFAFALLRNTPSNHQNVAISPFGVSSVLSSLINAADDDVAKELKSLLEFGDMDVQDINETYKTLLGSISGIDKTSTFKCANSIWVKKGMNVKTDFANDMGKYYNAKIMEIDPNANAFAEKLNGWFRNATNGMIDNFADPSDAYAQVVLANALYFKGSWQEKFGTQKGDFMTPNGLKVVSKIRDMRYAYGCSDEKMSLLELPYGNGAFSMVVLLPNRDKSLSELLECIDNSYWKRINSFITGSPSVEIQIPKFDTEFDLSCGDVIDQIAGKPIFGSMLKGLHGLSDECGEGIMQLTQRTVIHVDEEGTVAASATKGGYSTAPAPTPLSEFIVDRPFAYLIRESSTGVILFMGTVEYL